MKALNQITVLALAATLLILFFSVKSCRENEMIAENWKAQSAYKDTVIRELVNKNGQLVAEKQLVETNSAKDIEALSAKIFNLEKGIKKVTALLRATQVIKITDTLIVFEPGQPQAPDTGMIPAASAIVTPMKFSQLGEHFSISGTVEKKGVTINSLLLPNTISFRIAEKKEGLFKPRLKVVQVINSNPLFVTQGAQSIVLKERRTAWDRWIGPVVYTAVSSLLTYKLTR